MKSLPIYQITIIVFSIFFAGICQAQKIEIAVSSHPSLHGMPGPRAGADPGSDDRAWALVDGNGTALTPYIYSHISLFYDSLVIVTKDDKSGYMNPEGKVVIPLLYDKCEVFANGTALVWNSGKCGLIDRSGKIIVPIGKYAMIYNEVDPSLLYTSNEAENIKDDRSGLLTNTGKVIFPVEYENIAKTSDGAIRLTKQGKDGYYIRDTKLIIPCKYDKSQNFSEGFAAVQLNKKWGFINKKGVVVIPIQYDAVESFKEGSSKVTKKGITATISRPQG